MINKELKRLSRRELVDIIYQLKKNEQNLQDQIAALQDALEDKRIRISNAGSIADAAADITKILTAAQDAADLYLNEIQEMKAEAQAECEKIIENAKRASQGSEEK